MTIPIFIIAIFAVVGGVAIYIAKGHPNALEQEIEEVSEEVVKDELEEIIRIQKQRSSIDGANESNNT